MAVLIPSSPVPVVRALSDLKQQQQQQEKAKSPRLGARLDSRSRSSRTVTSYGSDIGSSSDSEADSMAPTQLPSPPAPATSAQAPVTPDGTSEHMGRIAFYHREQVDGLHGVEARTHHGGDHQRAELAVEEAVEPESVQMESVVEAKEADRAAAAARRRIQMEIDEELAKLLAEEKALEEEEVGAPSTLEPTQLCLSNPDDTRARSPPYPVRIPSEAAPSF